MSALGFALYITAFVLVVALMVKAMLVKQKICDSGDDMGLAHSTPHTAHASATAPAPCSLSHFAARASR